MVTVGSAKKKKKHEKGLLILFCVFYCIATAGIAVFSLTTNAVDQPQGPNNNDPKLRGGSGLGDRPTSVVYDSSAVACRYKSLDFLSADELQPKAGPRHMVNPPSGGTLSLVCCNTTAGPLSIVAHHQWAPLGVQRFLEMVTTGYFDKGVPLMRCVHNFLCQFGLNADPTAKKMLTNNGRSIPDDPNWLPEGKAHRQNSEGVKRFAYGYLAYAGSGPNSRGTQLIVSLKANGPLGGGSPWEVPFGEVVGTESFDTLSHIYTGYGEDGPSQGKLMRQGFSEELKQEFPLLDHVLTCRVLDERQ